MKDGAKQEELFLIFNPNRAEVNVTIPEGNWNILVQVDTAGVEPIGQVEAGICTVAPISAMVLEKCEK